VAPGSFARRPTLAEAHPLGNFTINHYAGIEVAGRDVTSATRSMSPRSRRTRWADIRKPGYPARLADKLVLTLDGRRVPLEVVSIAPPRPGAAA
jgi:hypothetical protein